MLADMLISSHLEGRIIDNAFNLDDMDSNNRYYNPMKRELALHSTLLGVFTLLYFLVGLLVLNLFAITAVSYAVACVYASKDTNFKQVIRVVPKAWKKLVLTYLWNLFLQLVFIAVFVALVVLCLVIGIRAKQIVLAIVIGVIVVILFIVGMIYFNVMWGMASVVSVLEECRGPRAFKRSGELMKGKKKLNIGVCMVFLVLLVVIQGGYWVLAGLFNSSLPIVVYVIVAIVFFLLLLGLVMLGLVVQTVLYLVCKSYHNESIDKASLGDQLDSYLSSYGRLGGAKDVQLGEV
ncbi:hypothetical protein Syun_014408 [Stephania yunnanensis]|uniref:Uncharacterized protein n=1 Tax=Stephania yunnanensis TaxID=152371 RepID=A0AAP0JKZ2_9MAGN